jgi:hypothetical protein
MCIFRLTVLLFGLFCTLLAAQDTTSIDLRGRAAFRIGDDDVWRSKYIDEQEGWNFITVPGAWEHNGFPLTDGFAWYRVRFRIPASMRDDSLLLVISGVDDADETFLNGVMVGKTGGFPPELRSELRSLRVYPLPRFIREEHNLLAVRVYDMGDFGGITGSIFRIVRADSMHRVLDEILDAPPVTPPRFLSNGVMVSAFLPDSAILTWCNPHVYGALSEDLHTETVLRRLALEIEDDRGRRPYVPVEKGYLGRTGIYRTRSVEGVEAFWYHPLGTEARLLVVAVRHPEAMESEMGLGFVMERPYWRYEERSVTETGMRTTYHILAYNSCCTELVDRDMEDFLDHDPPLYTLVAQEAAWKDLLSSARYLPEALTGQERMVYRRAVTSILQAQVRENGLGAGQIVSALEPASRAVTVPADHLLAAQALAAAGMHDAAGTALRFLGRAESGTYTLFDVLGEEYGVGFPYLVSPARYFGMGTEWRWQRPDDAVLRYDGMPRYLLALEALRAEQERRVISEGRVFSDSAFLAPYWSTVSARVADVIMYRLDSSGFLSQDDSPWGDGLTELPGVYSTILAVRALRIVEDYATVLGHPLKAFLYAEAAARAEKAIRSLATGVLARASADQLTPLQQRLFHPFIIDAVSLGIFPPGSAEAQLAFDIVETGFSIEDSPLQYRAQPGGDWFARQARSQLALRLARAYAVAGDPERAEALFASVTAAAATHDGILPELIEPVSGNWYGGIPHIPTAADYILTAERITMARLLKP